MVERQKLVLACDVEGGDARQPDEADARRISSIPAPHCVRTSPLARSGRRRGWRSLEVMQDGYQHADAAGIYSAIEQPRSAPEREPTRHTTGTPDSQATAS